MRYSVVPIDKQMHPPVYNVIVGVSLFAEQRKRGLQAIKSSIGIIIAHIIVGIRAISNRRIGKVERYILPAGLCQLGLGVDGMYVVVGVGIDNLEPDHPRVTISIGRAPRRGPIIHIFRDINSGRHDRVTVWAKW